MFTGYFITFEGGEGAGKTSLIPIVAQYFIQKGYDVICTREPGGSRLGETVRALILQGDIPIKPISELLLFLAARTQHLEELIIPALKAGKVILCDRFNDSTIAYQGAARDLGVDYVETLCKLACQGQEPHLTFLLDIPVDIGLLRTRLAHKREAASGEFDRIEAEKDIFHEKVRQALLQRAAAEPHRFITINASQPLEAVHQEALQQLELFIK